MAEKSRILSIKEVNRYIRMKMEQDELLSDVWLRGEISNFTHHSSGHMYFTLKDSDSRLKCVMFASHNARLPFRPKEGAKVMARGNISVFERDGNYQFYVMVMQPDGIGSLYLAYEQLKEKLAAEGLFSQERKRSLPSYPKAIGVITSPTGAAVRDILTTLQRRYPLAAVTIYPVLVQGAGAAPSIVKAIEDMNSLGECDVLIVGRGGGSLEELWAFNEEAVARAIVASIIPVISAVGHETDYTIADFAADLRAATPTAAAELAVPHIQELRQQGERLASRLTAALSSTLRENRDRLARLQRSPFFVHPRKYLLEQAQRVDRLEEQLHRSMELSLERRGSLMEKLKSRLLTQHPGEKAAHASRRLSDIERRMKLAASGLLKERGMRLNGAVRQLDALSPLKVMSRGYGLVYGEKQRLVKSVQDISEGEQIQVKLADGELECRVLSLKGDQR